MGTSSVSVNRKCGSKRYRPRNHFVNCELQDHIETIHQMSRVVTKPTKWMCAQRRLRSVWASAQSDQSLCCPHEESFGTLSYPLSAQRRLWSDWADDQADLSLRWAHSHIDGFVTRRLKYRKWYGLLLPHWVHCLNKAKEHAPAKRVLITKNNTNNQRRNFDQFLLT